MTMKKESNVKCMICGEEHHCRFITRHMKKVHGFTQEDFVEYHFKYLRDDEKQGICKCVDCNERSTLFSQSVNLNIYYGKFCKCHSYCARLSPVNTKYWIDIFGQTEEEAKESVKPSIIIAQKGVQKAHKEKRFFIPSQLEYWLKKTDGDEEEAKRLLNERQSTFSKEKCIKEHGKEKGIKIWKERQTKWQKTMCDKPIEEIERINKAKMFKYSYSKISQELFIGIYEKIKKDFSVEDVYFATLKRNGEINDDGNNDEYFLSLGDGRHRLLDFYIPSLKRCIEYDGEYWHLGKGAELSGNKERDILREQQIKDKGIEILHIKERDYKKDPESAINECIEFIKIALDNKQTQGII